MQRRDVRLSERIGTDLETWSRGVKYGSYRHRDPFAGFIDSRFNPLLVDHLTATGEFRIGIAVEIQDGESVLAHAAPP